MHKKYASTEIRRYAMPGTRRPLQLLALRPGYDWAIPPRSKYRSREVIWEATHERRLPGGREGHRAQQKMAYARLGWAPEDPEALQERLLVLGQRSSAKVQEYLGQISRHPDPSHGMKIRSPTGI